MKLTLLAAIADSIATSRCVRVEIPFLGIKNAIRFIERTFDDVDWDPHFDRITVFGDDASIPVADDGDGDEGHFVIDLVFTANESNPFNE